MRIGRSNSYMASYKAIRHSRSGGTAKSRLKATSRRTATKASTSKSASSADNASVNSRLKNRTSSVNSTAASRGTTSAAALSAKNAAAKQHYSAVVKSAATFSKNIEKLSGEKSQLFANAKSDDADTAAKAKKEIIDAVKTIVSDYNSMYQHLGASTDSMSKSQTKQLKSMTRVQSLAFNKIGITQSSAGALQLDEKTLEAADIGKFEKLFKGTDSFAMRWAAKAQTVSKNAAGRLEGLEALNSTTSSGYLPSYSSSGSVIGNYDTSGTRWSTQA